MRSTRHRFASQNREHEIGFPLCGSSRNPAPILRAAPSPCGIVLDCAPRTVVPGELRPAEG
jgi:hypothetical protein